MVLEFPGRREGFVHDIASGDRAMPLETDANDIETTLFERQATRNAIKNIINGSISNQGVDHLDASKIDSPSVFISGIRKSGVKH